MYLNRRDSVALCMALALLFAPSEFCGPFGQWPAWSGMLAGVAGGIAGYSLTLFGWGIKMLSGLGLTPEAFPWTVICGFFSASAWGWISYC